jgi:hypothetical protein
VISLDNTEPWALAGVVIRETLAAGSKHAFVGCTVQHGISFSRRPTTGGTTLYSAGVAAPAPYWSRLTRNGNTLTAFSSPDGINWTQVGSQSISMTETVFVGLAYSSHVNSQLGTATFDHVLLTGPNVNNPPEITFIPKQTINANTVAGPIAFTIGDVETPAAELTLTATSSVPSLVAVEAIVFGGANSNRTVTITPQPDASGLTTLTLRVSDGTNTTATAFALEVLPVNNPPIAWPDLITRWMSQGVSVAYTNLTANDTDADGDEITITSVAEISAAGRHHHHQQQRAVLRPHFWPHERRQFHLRHFRWPGRFRHGSGDGRSPARPGWG